MKTEVYGIDNPVSGRVESRLNLGAHYQVALRCGTERLWLSAQSNPDSHHSLETGREVTRLFAEGLSLAARVSTR